MNILCGHGRLILFLNIILFEDVGEVVLAKVVRYRVVYTATGVLVLTIPIQLAQ